MSERDQIKEMDRSSGNVQPNSISVNGSDLNKRISGVDETKRASTSSANRDSKSLASASDQDPKSPGASNASALKTPALGSDQVKKAPTDFKFGKVIGEGSFSQVYLVREVSSQKEYAMKVLTKKHIIREKKTQYVKREKEVLLRLNHPFFIKLHFTFQDDDRLYFGLSYAQRGELLDYIKKLGCFDENCTRFYVAEIIEALEYLHGLHIIHRENQIMLKADIGSNANDYIVVKSFMPPQDATASESAFPVKAGGIKVTATTTEVCQPSRDLKPENILLNDEMHIQITDFGSAKILDDVDIPTPLMVATSATDPASRNQRRNSFVGTAQYVSPEMLKNTQSFYSSDLWALGCIIYQLLSGQHPFWGSHEYQIFQKVSKLDYEIPTGFNASAQDLVRNLLVLDPTKRLGCDEMGGYAPLKAHVFLHDVPWGVLHTTKPPVLLPYLPAKSENAENLWGGTPGLDDRILSQLLEDNMSFANGVTTNEPKKVEKTDWFSDEERRSRLEVQAQKNEYHRFVEKNLILKQGLMDKRKGLFARRRMFLLTEGPRLFYVDPSNMVLKGEIPWSKELRPEAKNFKILFVHTPNRIYYLEDPKSEAPKWCKEIKRVWSHYYDNPTS